MTVVTERCGSVYLFAGKPAIDARDGLLVVTGTLVTTGRDGGSITTKPRHTVRLPREAVLGEAA